MPEVEVGLAAVIRDVDLAVLRDLRLDGRVRTKDDERAAVADWMLALARKGESR